MNPSLPAWVDAAIGKAVHPDHRYRYDTLSEFCQDLSHPNRQLLSEQSTPLIGRHPVDFWKGLSLLLFLSNLVLLYLMSG